MDEVKVLVACEESQEVCKRARAAGHEAYSCDIEPCSGGHPEWHLQEDLIGLLGKTTWDMIIAFPPCTYLTVTGNRWFNVKKYGKEAEKRIKLRDKAIAFFLRIINTNCPKIAIENPVGVISTVWRKPDQIIQPYEFGDPFEKRTCLWLKGLPKLKATNVVEPPPRQKIKNGKSMPEWYSNAPKAERAKIRSKTFPGIAQAMVDQWLGK